MTETTSNPIPDLDAYFKRIDYHGPHEATLATLQSIVLHHTQTIPFENLNPYLRLPVNLDLESLENKLVRSRRGGFCFEQSGLLRHILLALGYESRPLGARVVWNHPEGAMPPRSHMVQLITIDDEVHMVDVGFGGMTPTAPLRLVTDIEQETPHEPFRFVAAGEDFILEALIRDEWRPLYRFDLAEQQPSDYEQSNFWVCNHPTSHFITGISAALAVPGRRYALRDNTLTTHILGKNSEEQVLTSVPALLEVLETTFGITPPDGVDLHTALHPLIVEDGA